jgi:hypothetical protein
MKRSGEAPFAFIHREDLRALPGEASESEVNLHGMFAADRRSGYLYYGMPGCGILRIDPDLKRQEVIPLPDRLRPLNFHSTRLGSIGGAPRLFLPANNDALVAVLTLDGTLDFILSRPEFEQYQAKEAPFAPTDTVQVEDCLFVADGYGSNYITSADVNTRKWTGCYGQPGIFGGKTENPQENGRFATAHGINLHHLDHHRLVIADRPSARIQEHGLDGKFLASHALPTGAWPCGIDFIQWKGRWLAAIGSLVDPVKDRPAPIYVLDAETYAVLSTIRPKEELGIDAVQHLHNVVWHVQDGSLYLVCQAWNPGYYFVLECI